jgi:1-acyl-sn-glycerol-3-phosphate acyltransferase
MSHLRHSSGRHTRADGPDDSAEQLLGIVTALAKELHPHLLQSKEVTLDSDLDQDVGLDSLGRAELLQRVDKAFKIRLPDRVLGEADTPRDLLMAVRAAAPARSDRQVRTRADAVVMPRIEAPLKAETLIDVVGFHIHAHPTREHMRIRMSEDDEQTITYGDLDQAARKIAFGLTELGLEQGDRVAVMLATEAAFFEAFFGVLYAGGVPVPVYPPFRRSQIADHLQRQAGILNNSEAKILILAEDLRRLGSLLFGLTDNLKYIETVDRLTSAAAVNTPFPASGRTIALIQYTSGSTGDPKGVVLTHANLLANIRAMGTVLEASSDDIFVSWLPLYHDMGLIGAWLGSLYYGALAIIMPPLAFLADPSRWLRVISDYRATLSAAPNFAFELCTKNIRDEDIVGLDLSSIRMIVNGAEPVSPVTIERFAERFSAYGFRPHMMGPVYGLAENAVGLAFPPLGRGPVIDRIDRNALSKNARAVPVEDEDGTSLEFVACGRPIPGHEVRIVNEAGREVPERVEGCLQFKGPSATAGYFKNEEKNKTLFSGDWLESGDRAYLANGDVYVTGRIKDMIIKAGRNIYPHEIEELVGRIEGVRKGCVAAIASADQRTGTERLVLIVETRVTKTEAKQRLREEITQACTISLDMPPDIVELVPPHTVPKTSSGKIRRAAMGELYDAGLVSGARQRTLWVQLFLLELSGLGMRGRRTWRRIAEFAYAGYWWAVLVTIAFCLWPLVMLLPRRDWRHYVVHLAAGMFLRLTGATLKLSIQNALPEGNAVLIANHSSYLDSLVIAAVIPGRLTFVAKQELAQQWVAGPFLKRLGALFVRRTAAEGGIEDTERQYRAAREGQRIISFPEGTLTRMPGLLGFQLGAFVVAARAGVPVIPITIQGTRSILRAGQWFPHRGDIAVDIGKPVLPKGSGFDAAVRLRDRLRSIMLAHCGEPDLGQERATTRLAR